METDVSFPELFPIPFYLKVASQGPLAGSDTVLSFLRALLLVFLVGVVSLTSSTHVLVAGYFVISAAAMSMRRMALPERTKGE